MDGFALGFGFISFLLVSIKTSLPPIQFILNELTKPGIWPVQSHLNDIAFGRIEQNSDIKNRTEVIENLLHVILKYNF
jgi:hypothetical protein